MELIQMPWNPQLAYCSYHSLSPDISRSRARDCTIHSLVGLGFLSLEKGQELSRTINDNNLVGSMLPNIKSYLANNLGKTVSVLEYEQFRVIKKMLLTLLKVGYATLFCYEVEILRVVYRHIILVYKLDRKTLMCADIQKNINIPFDEYFLDIKNSGIIVSLLYSENNSAFMAIDDSEKLLANSEKIEESMDIQSDDEDAFLANGQIKKKPTKRKAKTNTKTRRKPIKRKLTKTKTKTRRRINKSKK